MQKTTTMIDSKVFQKNADGSWTAVQNTDINDPFGVIRIPRDMNFKKGRLMWGIDVVALLDESPSQPKV